MKEKINTALQQLNALKGSPDTKYVVDGVNVFLITRIQERFHDTFMQVHEIVYQGESLEDVYSWISEQLPAPVFKSDPKASVSVKSKK